jgi:outer membrane PBP1 activator LpoA protein
MYNTAGIKKVATIHDKLAYGQGLVASFTEEYKKLGGEVVAADTINPDEKEFASVITKVKSAGQTRSTTAASTRRRPAEPAGQGSWFEGSLDGWGRHLRPEVHRVRR